MSLLEFIAVALVFGTVIGAISFVAFMVLFVPRDRDDDN